MATRASRPTALRLRGATFSEHLVAVFFEAAFDALTGTAEWVAMDGTAREAFVRHLSRRDGPAEQFLAVCALQKLTTPDHVRRIIVVALATDQFKANIREELQRHLGTVASPIH